MRLARWCAVIVTIGVGTAAFLLSFSALRNLATMAHISGRLAALLPVDIDGTIILATVGCLVMANRPERRYFLHVLIAGATVSIAGNSAYGVMAGHGILSAVIGAVPPVSLLVCTHGLAVLFRAAVVSAPTVIDTPIAPAITEMPAPAVVEVAAPTLAAPRIAPRSKVITPERAATAVAMHAAGSTYRQIGRELRMSPATAHKYVRDNNRNRRLRAA
jgi:hypothetical protein